ncbi:MAG TPA: type I-U CRISPR-associated RAMP protein Csb1/Cas7u [Streptosporangiaceae bacterium]|nr:type I-U CRISPR-associated RAMP protein Csb1/Cas7u [Streptosporangiaceae bacterium]
MSKITLDLLLEASNPGGASCLTSVTELEPAAGPHASVAPAKFASPSSSNNKGVYAYERRFLDGTVCQAVIIDSKQSQLNRGEAALQQAIADDHPTLSRLPRAEVRYERDDLVEEFSDLTLPHRIFDGHIRAGTVDGQPVTQLPAYRAVRNATPANARALLDVSPVSLVFGSWDSSRASRQGRWRSVLVGEIVGFCEDDKPADRGGARVDPVGMQIQLGEAELKALADSQRAELSAKTYDKVIKEAARAKNGKPVSASMLGLGGIPPTLDALAGVACHRIVRSHVLSFATLRQIRFGAGTRGDAACRALLAALALNALARSDAELYLRANCDLRERGLAVVEIDQRGGARLTLDPLSVADADALLDAALATAEEGAGVTWNGVTLRVKGNPAIVAGAVADEDGAGS